MTKAPFSSKKRVWKSSTDSISVCVCFFCYRNTAFVTTFRLTFQITAGNFKYYYCYGYGRYEYMKWLITEIFVCSLLFRCLRFCSSYLWLLLSSPWNSFDGARLRCAHFQCVNSLNGIAVLCMYVYMRNSILHSFGID